MGVKDASISFRTLANIWEFCGTDRNRGVFAENLELVWDRWGSLSASFDLRRDPKSQWPDIAAFCQVDIEIGAVKVWAGRIKATPSRDGSDLAMNVQCEGWQFHLDDDVYQPFYVHTTLTDWKDARSNLKVSLPAFQVGYQVQVGSGQIQMGWPAQVAAAASGSALVYLDAGPTKTIARVVATYATSSSANSSGTAHFFESSDDMSNPIIDFQLNGRCTGASGSLSWTLPTARRFLGLLFQDINPAETTDDWVKFTSVKVFSSTAYESGGQSILLATTVIKDALGNTTSLLSKDQSRIATTSFAIPELASLDYKTAREVISAINAYHNYVTKIDEQRRMVFQPMPATASLEAGTFAAIEVEDASQNSGDDIYNRVIVEAQTPTGDPLKVSRSVINNAPLTNLTPITSPAMTNPSFATNTTGWSSLGGTLTRTTTAGEFDTSPGAGKIVNANFIWARGASTGTFKGGKPYVATIRARCATGTTIFAYLLLGSANANPTDRGYTNIMLTDTYQTFQVQWTPSDDRTDGVVEIQAGSNAGIGPTVFFDTVALFTGTSGLIDKQGFRRTKLLQVEAPLPDDGAAAAQIGDTYLAGHTTTPFKGSIQITGPIRDIGTGQSIPAERLGMRTNELIRLTDRVDPDTGNFGRAGRIAQVTYTLATDTAKIDLDSTSQNFETFLSRLAEISSAG